jgi:general secretion pathway protein L
MIPFSRALEVGRSTVLETTPFNLDAVYVIPIEDDIILRISVVVIKRDVLNDFLDTTAAEFIKPETLGICIGGRVISLPSRALENLHHVFAHLKRRKQMLTIIFAAALIALSITYTQLALRYSAAEDQLENIVEAKRGEALQVRKLFDQQQKTLASIEAARQGKDQAVSLVRLWEEATRTVPDDAWITDLNFDGQTVTMSGFASRSASLIGDLGASPFFKDPTFTSPVVRVPGKAGERFELRAQVTRP